MAEAVMSVPGADVDAPSAEPRVRCFRFNRTLLLVPVLVFFAAFFFYPLWIMIAKSVTDTPAGASAWSNFAWFFEEESNLRIYGRTLLTLSLIHI